MNQERFWVLLSRKLAGEADKAELVELEELIQQNPGWQYAVETIEDIWGIRREPDQLNAESAFDAHLHRMNERNIPFAETEEETSIPLHIPKRRTWYYAAAVVIGILAFLGLRQFNQSGPSALAARQVNEITTRPGSKTRIELPDGSIVWLNSGSKLTYNNDFNQQVREVSLTGEGYFDVAKNKEKPFIINTSTIRVKVLGTVFNVKAYPQDKKTETSLIRGSVEVTIRNRPNNKIILSPSEKLIVENDHSVVEKKAEKHLPSKTEQASIISLNRITYSPADSTIAETEWINNRLVFRDESFEELAIKMERWYNLHIRITDEGLKEKRLSGSFESETITQALEALKLSIPFRYEQQGTTIIIHR